MGNKESGSRNGKKKKDRINKLRNEEGGGQGGVVCSGVTLEE